MRNISFVEIAPKTLTLAQYVVLKCNLKSYTLHQMSY